MVDKQELYQNHVKTIYGKKLFELLTEGEVNNCWGNLLMFLPNDGKLYKYRSIEGESFENAFDGLKNGYLWMAKASTLNDDLDVTVNHNPMHTVEGIKNILKNNPYKWFKKAIQGANIEIGHTKLDHYAFRKVMECINQETGELNENLAIQTLIKQGKITKQNAIKYIQEFKDFVDNHIRKNEFLLEEEAQKYLRLNNELREYSFIYCMSEDYDNDSMWAYYANNNRGFCIEYDYKLAQNISFETRYRLIQTFKVIYGNKPEFYFEPMIKCILDNKKDLDSFKKMNLDIFQQMFTKSATWEHEKE